MASLIITAVGVQAVVKEGTSGPPRLVVKMSISKPRKGDPRFVKQLLEQAKELQQEEELAADDKVAAQLLSVPKLGSGDSCCWWKQKVACYAGSGG
jgi:hypothetical protein